MLTIWVVKGQEVDIFAREVMTSFGYVRPAFIMDPEEHSENPVSLWENWQKSTVVATVGDLNEIEILVGQANALINAGYIDCLFFLSPMKKDVIKMFTINISTIHPKIPMLIPHDHPINLFLRLDSRLFIYHIFDDKIRLLERYRIR